MILRRGYSYALCKCEKYLISPKWNTGHRDMLLQLGFAEKELLTEFGYPTQRFVLPPKKQEDM